MIRDKESRDDFEQGLDGRHRRRVPSGIMADPSILFEETSEEAGPFPAGVVRWLDGEGREVAQADLGRSTDDGVVLEVLHAGLETDFAALAEELRQDGQQVAWILAETRAVARGKNPERIGRAIRELHPGLAREHAEVLLQVVEGAATQMVELGALHVGLVTLADSLLLGAPFGSVIEKIAAILDEFVDSKAALELVEGALALEPDQAGLALVRSLILIGLGEPGEAARSIEVVAQGDPDSARDVLQHLAFLYPGKYEFWCKQDIRAQLALTAEPNEDLELVRGPDDLRWLIQATASRIALLRDEVISLLGGAEPDWLVPVPGRLLPDGPLELSDREQPDMDDSLVSLNKQIRVEWERLCWACWIAGLDDLGLPDDDCDVRDIRRLTTVLLRWNALLVDLAEQVQVEPNDEMGRRLWEEGRWAGGLVRKIGARVAQLMLLVNAELLQSILWLSGEDPSPFINDDEDDDEDEDGWLVTEGDWEEQ